MNTTIVYGIVISLILGVATFIASNNYIVGIAIMALGILYFSLIARPLINKYDTKRRRFRECYHFINTFIVSLSVKATIQAAYETSVANMSEEFVQGVENIDTFSIKEKLEHLSKYFRFHVFALFVDLVNIYEEQGGDIIDMSRYLLDEVRLTEEYISDSSAISRKRVMEFATLWFLSLLIMAFMRFALSEFYEIIAKQLFYIIGVFGIGFFCLVTTHIAVAKMCHLRLKGWNDAEKV